MNMVQQILRGCQKILETVCHFLEEGMTFQEFEEELWETMRGVGREILKVVLKAKDQEIRKDEKRKEHFEVVRKDERTILTLFGDVTYQRTYYRNRVTREYTHLLDSSTGWKKKRHIDPLLEAFLLEEATDASYRRAGKVILQEGRDLTVSPEVTKRLVHHLERVKPPLSREEGERVRRKFCPYLFIEADEDHVTLQKKRKASPRKGKTKRLLAKLVYVHEGKVKDGGRDRLCHPHYFAGLYENTESLWYEVLEYLEEHYDLDRLECIFLCGDGASWIQKGLEVIPKSVFVLDRFHFLQRAREALAHCPHLLPELHRALQEGSWEGVQGILRKAHTLSSDPRERNHLRDLRTYLARNWQGVENHRRFKHLHLGVSAEAHVSHVLAARLSHRPMAWSRRGVDRMSYLRALRYNGQSIRHFYLRTYRENLPPFTLPAEVLKREREKGRETFREIYGNLPVLKGPTSSLWMAIKLLSQDYSWTPVI